MLPFKLIYSDDYYLPIGTHVFPAEKYRRVRDRLLDLGIAQPEDFIVPQSASEYVGRMKEFGIRHFRVDLLRETPEQVVKLLDHYSKVIDGLDDGKHSWKQLKALNQLGVTRGTLKMA